MASTEDAMELSESPKGGEGQEGEAAENKIVSEVMDAEVEVRKPPERKERAAKREKAKAKKEEAKKEGDENSGEVEGAKVGSEAKMVEPPVDDGEDVAMAGEALTVDGEEGRKVRRRKAASKEGGRKRTKSRDESRKSVEVAVVEAPVPKEEKKEGRLKIWWQVCKDVTYHWRTFGSEEVKQRRKIASQRNRCVGSLMLMIIYVGLGAMIFRFTEGAFEAFYKCGVKRVKRDFVDGLWSDSRALSEDEWKSRARRRLMELEGQLQTAYEAGVTTYSGRRAWSFLNAVVYCLTVVTTIGYGHIAPATNTGRAITIVYAIFGIPMFLILLADFGKLFTRGIKFLWAFVRRLYYTGSCKKVRRTGPVQEVMKGVQLVYDFATFRRPSTVIDSNSGDGSENLRVAMSPSVGVTLASPEGSASQPSLGAATVTATSATPDSIRDGKNSLHVGQLQGFAGPSDPGTPAVSAYAVDDEFNLPISVAIIILLGYIFVGATIYFSWEEWSFFESFYFVFISMSTIGFGDYVPQHPMYMMASIVYLIFGLALTSMCINVVQEKLSDSFRQASVKIGATIGLQVTEEEEAALAAQKVELAEVHTTGKKQDNT